MTWIILLFGKRFAVFFIVTILIDLCLVDNINCAQLVTHKPVDVEKCSLTYVRELVFQSCIRPHPNKRKNKPSKSKRHAVLLQPLKTLESIQAAMLEKLPANHSLTAIRRKRRSPDSAIGDKDFDYYFRYCCEHMDICENMECIMDNS